MNIGFNNKTYLLLNRSLHSVVKAKQQGENMDGGGLCDG